MVISGQGGHFTSGEQATALDHCDDPRVKQPGDALVGARVQREQSRHRIDPGQ
jgi:hypothetical protein